jgi:bifunctional UDP-N-acetylglucosamine pyrophosphorylase/glucosamine-1-phosphate N-acetyltransferase
MSSTSVVILAAGQGKRMRSTWPKVLHQLAGRPLLAHVLETARALGPRHVCVVCGHGADAVRTRFQAPDVSFALQEPQLGTGHAVMQALPHIDAADRVLVLYGDVPLTQVSTLAPMLGGSANEVWLLTVELADPTGYGRIVRNAAGNIERIVEHKDANARELEIREVNTGIMALPGGKLKDWLGRLDNNNAQGEYYLTDVIAMAITDKVAVNAHRPTAEWETLGVNSRAQLAQLERLYQAHYAAGLLERGVALADPARIDVRGELVCGMDVSIDVNCVFEGKVELADNVSIGPNCVLADVSVGPWTRVEAFCHLQEADVGANCRIGPYARLRPGARLAQDVHIGNFVEVKQSDIGAHSKANHLSYIGDSTLGRNVNIGAGTITCNYDGANKHRTVIEDDVHIGSDTQLVAPVTVGRGVTTGAGATVTKDVPPGSLMYTQAQTVIRRDWRRPVKPAKTK